MTVRPKATVSPKIRSYDASAATPLKRAPYDGSSAKSSLVIDENLAYDQSAAIWPRITTPAWLFGKKPCDASLAKSTTTKKSVTNEIDNNPVENAIRPTALGKKNWLFMGDADAGERGAIIYTIIGTPVVGALILIAASRTYSCARSN